MLRPGMDALAFISTGLLPSDLRRGYGLRWTPAHAVAFAAMTRSLRLATPGLPRRLRISPVYDLALARAEGRWPRCKGRLTERAISLSRMIFS